MNTFLKANLIMLLVFFMSSIQAEDLKIKLSLQGYWKFTIGDDPQWADPEFDDRDWDRVFVPKSWESNGFEDYNGFAWYRKDFTGRDLESISDLFLVLGYIDDVDEVYLNGQLIGTSGVFPPKVETAHRLLRKYPLPEELLKPDGINVVAIRVFDDYNDGGILRGPIGVFEDADVQWLSYNLAGYWDFETLLRTDRTANIYPGEGKIYVPGTWESSGYKRFDGSATYTTTFELPPHFNDDDMMLVVGYIDDVDKVYVNDQLIGTVDLLKTGENLDKENHWILRGYALPQGSLRKGGVNTINVKVYDVGGLGGIIKGPVGLIRSDNYEQLLRMQEEQTYGPWEVLYKMFFE